MVWIFALGGCGCLLFVLIMPALLLPVFHQARVTAESTRVASSVKQIAVAMLTYASDHDDLLPPDLSSVESLKLPLMLYLSGDPWPSVAPYGLEVNEELASLSIHEIDSDEWLLMTNEPDGRRRIWVAYVDASIESFEFSD